MDSSGLTALDASSEVDEQCDLQGIGCESAQADYLMQTQLMSLLFDDESLNAAVCDDLVISTASYFQDAEESPADDVGWEKLTLSVDLKSVEHSNSILKGQITSSVVVTCDNNHWASQPGVGPGERIVHVPTPEVDGKLLTVSIVLNGAFCANAHVSGTLRCHEDRGGSRLLQSEADFAQELEDISNSICALFVNRDKNASTSDVRSTRVQLWMPESFTPSEGSPPKSSNSLAQSSILSQNDAGLYPREQPPVQAWPPENRPDCQELMSGEEIQTPSPFPEFEKIFDEMICSVVRKREHLCILQAALVTLRERLDSSSASGKANGILFPELTPLFVMTREEIADHSGVCLTHFKRSIKPMGITRWPSRKYRQAQRQIRKLTTRYRNKIQKSAEKVRDRHSTMYAYEYHLALERLKKDTKISILYELRERYQAFLTES